MLSGSFVYKLYLSTWLTWVTGDILTFHVIVWILWTCWYVCENHSYFFVFSKNVCNHQCLAPEKIVVSYYANQQAYRSLIVQIVHSGWLECTYVHFSIDPSWLCEVSLCVNESCNTLESRDHQKSCNFSKRLEHSLNAQIHKSCKCAPVLVFYCGRTVIRSIWTFLPTCESISLSQVRASGIPSPYNLYKMFYKFIFISMFWQIEFQFECRRLNVDSMLINSCSSYSRWYTNREMFKSESLSNKSTLSSCDRLFAIMSINALGSLLQPLWLSFDLFCGL